MTAVATARQSNELGQNPEDFCISALSCFAVKRLPGSTHVQTATQGKPEEYGLGRVRVSCSLLHASVQMQAG